MPDSGATPVTSRRPRRKRSWRFRLIVLGLGLVCGLVLAETAYRIKLAVGVGGTPLGVGTTFQAWSEATVRDDPVAGYSHDPGRKVVGVRVARGRAVLSLERTSNAAGVIGPSESRAREARTRILVVGDSFTENQRQGTTWPALMQAELNNRIEGTVSVISRARSGHGLLQMIDVAAHTAGVRQFDVVVVAFITDDLNRARFWQETRTVGRELRLATRLSRDDAGWLALSEFYDKRIDAQWCRKMIETGGANDEVMADLLSRFKLRKRDNPNRIDYASLSSSFLYNRLIHGDPFFGIEGIAATPRFSWWDFRRDSGVVQAMEELRKLEANVVLVHLPQYEELVAGEYLMSEQQRSLLQSLEQLAGVPAVNLFERGNLPTRPKSLFLLPVDNHPSREGLRWYAGAVGGVIEQMATAAGP
ncbi:MAG: SGNH/GDSL hydrolase family protein [Planctomycetota bacterium]|nr:SGNH/GDSL hydrolase family protein [Planctomycetota bacterium]